MEDNTQYKGIRICWEFPDGKMTNCLHLPSGYGFVPQPSSALRQHEPVRETAQGVYSEFLTDAAIIGNIHSATQSIADKNTRDALQGGIESAVKALQKRVSEHGLHISFDD